MYSHIIFKNLTLIIVRARNNFLAWIFKKICFTIKKVVIKISLGIYALSNATFHNL